MRRNRSLERRAAAIEARINGQGMVAPGIVKRAEWLVEHYGASQRLADSVRHTEPVAFWGAVADEIEARIK